MLVPMLRRRPAAMAVLVVVLSLALVASSARMAEASPGYFVSIAPSAATMIGWTTAGGAVWASSTGLTVGAGGAIAAGGVAVLPAAAVAVGGFLLGWGIVEAAKWAWSAGQDPEPATVDPAGDPVLLSATWTGGSNVGQDCGVSPRQADNSTCRHTVDQYELDVRGDAARAASNYPNEDGVFAVYYADGTYAFDKSAKGPWGEGATWVMEMYPQSQGVAVGSTWTTPIEIWWQPNPTKSWQPHGSLLASVVPPGAAGDGSPKADRQLVGQVACYDPSSGVTSTHDFASPLYAPGNEPDTPSMACPAGHVLTGANLTRTVEGNPGATETLLDVTHPGETTVTDPTWQYADCVDGSCALVLTRILADGTRADCEDDQINCLGWWDSPNKASEFECLWGPHVVPLSDCDMFREIDSPTWTGPDQKPQPVQTAPGTAANPLVVDDGCDVGFSDFLNPLSGLAKGVGCGLEWAFAPTAATSTRVDDLGTQLRTKAPAAQLNSIGTWVSDLGTVGTGCLHFDLDLREWGQYEVFDCNGQVGSEMSKHRTILTVAFYGSFLLPLGWWAWRTYAPGATGTA